MLKVMMILEHILPPEHPNLTKTREKLDYIERAIRERNHITG